MGRNSDTRSIPGALDRHSTGTVVTSPLSARWPIAYSVGDNNTPAMTAAAATARTMNPREGTVSAVSLKFVDTTMRASTSSVSSIIGVNKVCIDTRNTPMRNAPPASPCTPTISANVTAMDRSSR